MPSSPQSPPANQIFREGQCPGAPKKASKGEERDNNGQPANPDGGDNGVSEQVVRQLF